MNDEVIWQTGTPYHIKFFIWLGALVSFVYAILYLVVFAITIYFLPAALRNPTSSTISIPGIISDMPIGIGIVTLCKYILIICAIGCLIHFICGYGTYKTRKMRFPLALIIIYTFIATKISVPKTPINNVIFFAVLASCGLALYGCIRFYIIRKGIMDLQKNKDTDPYDLYSTSSDIDVSNEPNHYEAPPEALKVEVDTSKLKKIKKEKHDDDDTPRKYF